jgi:hypothetical protein
MAEDRHVYGEVENKTELRELFKEIRKDVDQATPGETSPSCIGGPGIRTPMGLRPAVFKFDRLVSAGVRGRPILRVMSCYSANRASDGVLRSSIASGHSGDQMVSMAAENVALLAIENVTPGQGDGLQVASTSRRLFFRLG